MSCTFNKIANILAAVRCLNGGQTVAQVAASAKVKPNTVRSWLSQGGFKKIGGEYRIA